MTKPGYWITRTTIPEEDLPEKAEILHVGGWDDELGAVNWAFGPCQFGAQIFIDGREPLFAGYIRAELYEIWRKHNIID